ncbi:uncharacterized protein si:ch211-105c13.3 isoform X2 [Anguilla anguilla]|uniref:uncharacterized protein si:ch211-105c13.3 isoform X2 n=1 Tax=Anguilla anguilla TaxID=7936 RepID=UPI0015B120A2|nr:uncharacterized protein si:ch211-105c13.3 isoform X2 [Anguilla anguilla]
MSVKDQRGEGTGRMSIESAIKTFVMAFLKASKGRENMQEKDFQKLVTNQLKNIMAETDSASAVDEIREGLPDKQGAKQVGFKEFMDVIGCVATKLSEKQPVSEEPAAENPEAL